MIKGRILLLGRPALLWAKKLEHMGADAFSISTARLPAQGIRLMEKSPPDVLVVVDDEHSARIRTLIDAVRARPIGPLLPIILICPPPHTEHVLHVAKEVGVDAYLDDKSEPGELIAAFYNVLGIEPDTPVHHEHTPQAIVAQDTAQDATQDTPQSKTSNNTHHNAYNTEPIDDLSDFIVEDVGPDHFVPPVEAISHVSRRSLFPVRKQEVRPGVMDIDAIRRKLKEVRHEDYYIILEVRRGAEGPVIRQAYQRLHARFDRDIIPFELAQRFHRELGEIRDAVEDAWAVLGDPELREQYMAATSVRI